jgi:hypothetical protein
MPLNYIIYLILALAGLGHFAWPQVIDRAFSRNALIALAIILIGHLIKVVI